MRRAFHVAVVMLLLTGAVSADDDQEEWQTEIEKKLAKPVSVGFRESTLSDALSFFRTFAGLNIILDSKAADSAEKRFTLKLDRVRVESGIAWTARLMDLDYAVRDEAVYLARRNDMPVDWRGAMQERYRRKVASGQESWLADIEARLERTIKVEFRNDHLPAVLEFLATQAAVNIVLDFHLLGQTTPIRLEGEMTVKNALSWVMRLTRVRYVVRDEVIYVANEEGLRALRLETGESPLPVVFRRPVTFRFQNTPVRDALASLSRYSQVKIELQGLTEDEALPVTVEGEGVELNRAVRMVMDKTGRDCAISHGGTVMVVKVLPKGRPRQPRDEK
ncbi:MAG TPA: hypothetical protein VMZ92_13985 [Planctomycetota bacterium]|nr:hypothetical protein [Planctomycetota bacterium]